MSTSSVKRPDIQGLRAIAVLLVIVFHVRPTWAPGGFVGVDVFFVISGFLITSSLAAEGLRDGSINLPAFWARRIRRLMPAATVVLAAVLVATALLLSVVRWPRILTETVASAFSVENWVLAAQSVDYLHATAAPTPVQHFWSLGVEEQFYLLWPLLLLLGLFIGRRTGAGSLRAWRVIVVVLFAVFLVWSVVETYASPSTAYFSTATRAWELLLGAGVALWAERLRPASAVATGLLVGGIAGIAASVLVISEATLFPGFAALLPTVGAALVIVSGLGQPRQRHLLAPLTWRPVTYVGDISYSLYLWHWPVIIVFSALVPKEPRLPMVLVVGAVALSFVLAALSTRFVERPFQHWRGRRVFVLGAALLATTGLLVGASYLNYARVTAELQQQADPRNFPGARILDPDFDASAWNDVVVPPIPNAIDIDVIPRQLTPGCMTLAAATEITTCDWGVPDGAKTVVVVGDSHAAQWLPMVDEVALKYDWRVVYIGKQYCSLTAQKDLLPIDPGKTYQECVDWNAKVEPYILELAPDLVIQGALSYGYPTWITESHADYDAGRAAGYAQAWQPILDAGIPIVAIREVPRFTTSAPQCITGFNATIDSCSESFDSLMGDRPSWLALAAQSESRVALLDLDPLICPDGICRPVIGNIITYGDDSHVGSLFARSAAWRLEDFLLEKEPALFTADQLTGSAP